MAKEQLRFAGLNEPFSDYGKARFAVIPVPYEKTVSYGKGTSRGPRAILDASRYMELYDEELECNTAESGIATLKPVLCNREPQFLSEKLRAVCKKVLADGISRSLGRRAFYLPRLPPRIKRPLQRRLCAPVRCPCRPEG